MNQINKLLHQASCEVLEFYDKKMTEEEKKNSYVSERSCWESLSNKMFEASKLSDPKKLKIEIHSIARMFIDSFPMTDEVSKSFDIALDTVQRIEKRTK